MSAIDPAYCTAISALHEAVRPHIRPVVLESDEQVIDYAIVILKNWKDDASLRGNLERVNTMQT